MSWFMSFSCTALDFDEKASLAQQNWWNANQDAGTETQDQVAASLIAARQIIYSATVHYAHGRPEGLYDVGLSGHANPGHMPREGWAHDAITVTVRQAMPPMRDEDTQPVENAEVAPEVPTEKPGNANGPTGTNAAPQPLAASAEPDNENAIAPPSPENPMPVDVAIETAPQREDQIEGGE